MRKVRIKNQILPALGIGTWEMGDDPKIRDEEIAAIRAGLDAGLSVIDTAEMYGNGRSEELVGEAIKPYPRAKIFLISKVLPQNASRSKMRKFTKQFTKTPNRLSGSISLSLAGNGTIV